MERKKLNVLLAIDVYIPDTDGVINCVKNSARYGNEMANITVIAPKNKRGYVDNLPYNIYRCNSIFVPFINQYYGFPLQDTKFCEQVRSQKYDIVHVHSPFNMCSMALKIAREQNIPIVATYHSNFRLIFQDLFGDNAISESFVKKIGKIHSKMDEVFVCSESVGEQIRSYGYHGKLSILPFGTELEKQENIEPLIDEANKLFGLPEDQFVGIYVGRVMPMKRIDFILRSLNIVKKKGYKFKFFVVGKGADMSRLKRITKKLELEDEVKFLGFVPREQFPLVNARADLLMFPSIYDNFGLVKVEAAAYKTAGLFIEKSNAGADVIDGVNGFLSKDNEADFAEKIIYCIKNRNNLKQVGQMAQDTLYMHWRDATEKLIEKYYDVIDNWKGRKGKIKKNVGKISQSNPDFMKKNLKYSI